MQTKIVEGVIKQSLLFGRWWGNLQTVAQHTNIYIQFLILAFSATSAYAVITTFLHQRGILLPFWAFILFLLVSISLLGLFVWRLSIPSTFATWNHQWWEHDNKIRPIVEQLQKESSEITNKLDRLEKQYEEIILLLQRTGNDNENQRIDKVHTKQG